MEISGKIIPQAGLFLSFALFPRFLYHYHLLMLTHSAGYIEECLYSSNHPDRL